MLISPISLIFFLQEKEEITTFFMSFQTLFVSLWKQICERAVKQLVFGEETIEAQKSEHGRYLDPMNSKKFGTHELEEYAAPIGVSHGSPISMEFISSHCSNQAQIPHFLILPIQFHLLLLQTISCQ